MSKLWKIILWCAAGLIGVWFLVRKKSTAGTVNTTGSTPYASPVANTRSAASGLPATFADALANGINPDAALSSLGFNGLSSPSTNANGSSLSGLGSSIANGLGLTSGANSGGGLNPSGSSSPSSAVDYSSSLSDEENSLALGDESGEDETGSSEEINSDLTGGSYSALVASVPEVFSASAETNADLADYADTLAGGGDDSGDDTGSDDFDLGDDS